MREYIEFNGIKYRVVEEFKIYHDGWEMDNEAWLCVDPNGKSVCIMTSHGGFYISTHSELQEFHDKHLSAAEAMARALRKIKESEK